MNCFTGIKNLITKKKFQVFDKISKYFNQLQLHWTYHVAGLGFDVIHLIPVPTNISATVTRTEILKPTTESHHSTIFNHY